MVFPQYGHLWFHLFPIFGHLIIGLTHSYPLIIDTSTQQKVYYLFTWFMVFGLWSLRLPFSPFLNLYLSFMASYTR